ncbi:MAG TPA: glycosyl hydrolase [Novosphingobium sp.]
MRRLLALLIMLCTTCASPSSPAQQAPAEIKVDPQPGVTTHFSQGWPPGLMAKAAPLGAGMIRDSLHWAQIETAPGQYNFTAANSGHVEAACAAGMKVLLGIEPRNKIYDGGLSAHTAAAQEAFARYLAAIATRYRRCVTAIEVGNEINGANNVTGPAAEARVAWYVSLLKAIQARVKPANPDLLIVGGSTNSIATGFQERLFAAGALDYMDAVAVHPYRNYPEGVDQEIARLYAAMARHGRPKPIWATEFSREFAKPADAAPFLLKMLMLLQSAGVQKQFWYAMIDQKWFPTMGLLTTNGDSKPAGAAFSFAAHKLAPLGPARRIDHGDPTLFHFRVGDRFDVVWGTPRSLTASGASGAFHAGGSSTAVPAEVQEEPVVIEGASRIDFGQPQVLADSLYGFAQPPLQWLARRTDSGAETPLVPIDWQWTTYLGTPSNGQMVVNQGGIGPAASASAVVRYVVTQASPLFASVCLAPQGTAGNGATAELDLNGKPVWGAPVGPGTGPRSGPISGIARIAAKPGDRIEFVLSPGQAPPGRMKYRFRVSRDATLAAGC